MRVVDKYWIKYAKSRDRNKSNTMILFLFSIFNIKKLFSVVSPPTFHLAPRSLNFAELAMHAMKRLQDNGKNNLIYKFALCISSNRPGSNDSLFPINRMPFGMV